MGEKGERYDHLEEYQPGIGNRPELQEHRCEMCSKVFGTRQALGGHKRVHSQAKKEELRKKEKDKKRLCEDKVDREPITTCPHCGTEFPSEKAMCGHMKVHKNRPQRGILPPEGGNSRVSPSPSTNMSSSEAIEASSGLKHGDRVDGENVVVGLAVFHSEEQVAHVLIGLSKRGGGSGFYPPLEEDTAETRNQLSENQLPGDTEDHVEDDHGGRTRKKIKLGESEATSSTLETLGPDRTPQDQPSPTVRVVRDFDLNKPAPEAIPEASD